jgi:hypothetical protein
VRGLTAALLIIMSSFDVRVLIEAAAERIERNDDRSTTTDESGMFDPLDLTSSITLLILVCDREAKIKSAGL